MGEADSLPLHGVRVLDLGQYIAGPCATVLLAELGAEVVKVEPPRGDPFRKWEGGKLAASFVAFNRGKQSVVLDLKLEGDRQRLLDLAADVDILVENFRPGVTTRLGIDWDALRAVNPALIYCSITGFGSTGPRAGLPAYDGVALGFSGLAGLLLDPEDLRMRGPALADSITGHSAAMSVLAALHERQRTGRGHHLEVSMLGSLVHFLSSAVSKRVVDGREEGPYTRAHASQAYAFAAADDRPLVIHLSSPEKFWQALCQASGRLDLLEDPRFATHRQRIANYEALREELIPTFRTRSRDAWLEALHSNDVPCAPVNNIGEVLEDEQLRCLGLFDVADDPDIGPAPQIRPPVIWDGAPLDAVMRAPLLDEHSSRYFGDDADDHLGGPDAEPTPV
jgi:crotonobetainyl-CoA:carnitine CoA-transferase CaiB-like acyl-CoA transferase